MLHHSVHFNCISVLPHCIYVKINTLKSLLCNPQQSIYLDRSFLKYIHTPSEFELFAKLTISTLKVRAFTQLDFRHNNAIPFFAWILWCKSKYLCTHTQQDSLPIISNQEYIPYIFRYPYILYSTTSHVYYIPRRKHFTIYTRWQSFNKLPRGFLIRNTWYR